MASQDPISLLVKKAQDGDSDAFRSLVERYQGRLERQIEARMGKKIRSGLEPADVLQETLTRAFESLPLFRFRGEESFYAWLGSIAEHLIWNVSKKRAWQPLRIDRKDSRQEPPSKLLRREERFERLEDALRGLSPDYRRVLTLSRVEGLSLKEIAAKMDRSPGAVQKLLARAVLRLREDFGDTESLGLPGKTFRLEEESSGE